MSERRKVAHFALWLTAGFLAHALLGCAGMKGLFLPTPEGGPAPGVTIAQGVAAVLGAPYLIPVISALGGVATAVYHGVAGVPGVPAVTERVKRKRAVRQAQRDAVKAGRPTVA